MSQSLPKGLLPFIMLFVKKQSIGFTVLMVVHLAWALDQTIFPYIFKVFLDRITSFTGDRAEIWPIIAAPLIAGGIFWLVVEAMFRTYDFVSVKIFPKFEADIRMAMVEYVQGHSHRYFADNFAGSMANKIGDIAASTSRIIQLLVTLYIPTVVAFTIGVSIFASMHPSFAIVTLIWVSLHMGVCFWYAKECDRRAFVHSEAQSLLSGKIVDSFTNIVAVKSFAHQSREMRYIGEYQGDEQRKHQHMLRLVAHIRLKLAFIALPLMGVVLTWLLVTRWQADLITSGDFVYVFYTSWGLMVMAWISGVELPNFFKEMGTCNQALELVRVDHEVQDVEDAKSLEVSKGAIAFENVTFHYKRGKNVFEDKSLRIEAGSKVGLVGFSGSGKTTFANLIMRFFDVQKGRILIDGQDISQVMRSSLRENIAMIPQDPTLFHRSIVENIRFGKPTATDEEVIEAAKKAYCHDFINELDKGYETLVGERGIKLSGGQRQRIAIARAILKDAPILILDEATSALDSVTEKHIQQGLEVLMEGKTTIVIAHRLSTLAEMDRILVFDQGHIIEDGAHQVLIEQEGHYATMWNMQAGGFLPEHG